MQFIRRINPKTLKLGVGFCSGALVLAIGNAFQSNCQDDVKTKDLEINDTMSPDAVVQYINSKDRLIECRTSTRKLTDSLSLSQAIAASTEILQKVKEQSAAPGIIVGVSVNGKHVWEEGFGYADLENRVPASYKTVMRIASISKCLTSVAVAKLYENGLLDLDKPIQTYLPDYPKAKYNNETFDITCRLLLGHTSGIRHYNKSITDESKSVEELALKEFLSKDNYKSVTDSLTLFKDDPLLYKPGTTYSYSTHGYTLLSAVVEAVTSEPFIKHMDKMFAQFGLKYTGSDVNDALIYNRSHYYVKSDKGKVQNAPYVDNSYKWAGGGLVSTVGDLLKLANIMLLSAQTNDSAKLPGYLKQSTIKMFWSPGAESMQAGAKKPGGYGLGWRVAEAQSEFAGGCVKPYYISHGGGAAGASSAILALPTNSGVKNVGVADGICVSILINMQGVGLSREALEIAELFKNVK